MRSVIGLAILALAGCATAQQTQGRYIRTDGQQAEAVQTQAILAQCRGEGARGVGEYAPGGGPIPWAVGMASRSSKEATLVDACMARNGYIAQ